MRTFFSAQQVSMDLGVRFWTLPRWDRNGHCASVHVGGRWLFSDEDRQARVQEGIAATRRLGCHSRVILNSTDDAPLGVMLRKKFVPAYYCHEASREGRSKTPPRVSGLAKTAVLDPGMSPPSAKRRQQAGQFTTGRKDER